MLGNTQVEILEILIRARDEATGTLRETAAHVEGMRGHLASLGQGMMTAGLGLGAGIAAIAGGSLKLAADFQKTMSGVQAVSGASAQQMKQLSGLALQLGKDTSFSAQEAGKGIEELVKGGVSIADILNGAAKATLNLAAAGGVDLPTAATIAANALNTFGLHGRDMAHVADMIAGAANASSLDVNDFKFSLAAAGAVAKTIGFNFDDLSVAIAELGAAGLRGSDAGTSLKTLFINLSPQTSHAADMMKKLGIITRDGHNAFFDMHGRVRSLAEVQGVLHRALSGLTKEQQINAMHTMFGTDAMRAAAILAGQGAEGYDKMAASMHKVTAEGVATVRLGNLAGQIEQFKGSMETLAIVVGQALLPGATAFAKTLTEIANRGIDIAQRLGPGFIKTAVALASVAAIALTVGGAVAMIVAVMNPIGLAVMAIVAAVGLMGAAWTQNWGHIRERTQGVLHALAPAFGALMGAARAAWAGIQHAVAVAWAYIKPALDAAMGAVLRFAHHILPTLGPAARNVFAFLQGAVQMLARVWHMAWDGIALQLRGAWDIIKGIVQVAWALVSATISVGLDVLSGKWGRIWGDIKAMYQGIWNGIVLITQGAGKMLLGAIQALLNGAMGVIGSFFPKFAQAGKHLIDGLVNGIKGAAHHAKDAIGHAITDHVINPAKHLLHIKSPSGVFAEMGQNMMQGLAQGVTQNSGMAKDAVNKAVGDAQHAGEHWVHGYQVRAHMVAGHYTHAGHWVRPHMVRAHEVAGHWAHNPTHAAAAAALTGGTTGSGASTVAGAATSSSGAGGVQLVAIASATGAPLEPLPVTLVNAAGQALALSGGAASAALGGAAGATGTLTPAAHAAVAAHWAHQVHGTGGSPLSTSTPLPLRGSGLAFGAHPHGGGVQIQVHVHDGAVKVHDAGGHDMGNVGQHVGNAIAGALENLAQSQLFSTPPARRTLPGAI